MATKRASKQSDSVRIKELEKENKQLRSQINQIKSGSKSRISFNWRMLAIGFSSAMAIILLVVGNLFFWTGRTLTETPRYVAITQPIIENPEVQTAIANKLTTQLFNKVDVEQIAQDALPLKAQFLAPSVAAQVQSFSNTKAKNLLANPEFQKLWLQVNTNAHNRLITGIKNYNGDGTFNVQDLYNRLSVRLQDGPMKFLANKELPSNFGTITIFSMPNLPKIHWLVVNLWWLRLLTVFSFLILTCLVIYLAKKKRKAIIRLMSGYIAAIVATLISLRVAERMAVNSVKAEYAAASKAVWGIVTQSLVVQLRALALVCLLVIVVACATGSGKNAMIIRSKARLLFTGKAHKALFKHENSFTSWVGRSKRALQIIVAISAILSLVVINLTVVNVFVLALFALSIIAVIEVLAAEK